MCVTFFSKHEECEKIYLREVEGKFMNFCTIRVSIWTSMFCTIAVSFFFFWQNLCYRRGFEQEVRKKREFSPMINSHFISLVERFCHASVTIENVWWKFYLFSVSEEFFFKLVAWDLARFVADDQLPDGLVYNVRQPEVGDRGTWGNGEHQTSKFGIS